MNNTWLFYSGWMLMNSEFYSLTTSDDLFNEPKEETDGISSQISAGVKNTTTTTTKPLPIISCTLMMHNLN